MRIRKTAAPPMDRWLETGSCSGRGADNTAHTVNDSSDESDFELEPQCSSEEPQRKRGRISKAVGTSKVRKYDASYIKFRRICLNRSLRMGSSDNNIVPEKSSE